MEASRWDAFVSYGHDDAEWVGALAGNLRRDGFEIFLDQWELVAGDTVTRRLEEGVRNSTSGVLVVTPHSLSRPWVREEYEALLRQAVEDPRRRLIPVLYLETELPPFLANRDWVDFRAAETGPAYDAALDRLERALRGQAAVDRPERGSAREWSAATGGGRFRPAGAMQLSLVISPDRTILRSGTTEIAQRPQGLRAATIEAVKELHWRREPGRIDSDSEDAVLAEVGRRLSADFLAGEVGAELARRVAEAVQLNEVLELGIDAQDAALAELPWEAVQLPEVGGAVAAAEGAPLALHRNVALFRQVEGLGAVAAYKVRGPLRILVAIASPESENPAGELLNYEAELARIVAAVDPARRRGEAHIRVLTDGSLSAIRAALSAEPEGFHVLHATCHARPGELVLETADGAEDRVSAARLLDEGLPAGVDLPLVVLSGCSTGLAADAVGEDALGGFGQQLLRGGVPAVLAMQGVVSDTYAAELTAGFYGHLATAESPEPLAAFSQARRDVERARQALPADSPRRARAEWATPALLLRRLRLPLFNRREPFGPVAAVQAPVLADGIVVRKVGEFVGRRRELRASKRVFSGAKAGLVIHAIGGVGKSTLAAEVISALGPQLTISHRGVVSVDAILDEVGARLSRAPSVDGQIADAAQRLRRADVEWRDRWSVLAETILPSTAMIVLLDNFEDNLMTEDGTAWRVRDADLGEFLAGWVRRPGESRLLFTSRHPFLLPDGAHSRRLTRLHLGPLSDAETAKLIWQLPGLDALSDRDRRRAYRDVGGHPRTLEYLDALLRGGDARFDDVAERMEAVLTAQGIEDPEAWLASPGRDLDSAVAEAVTLAVDDVVLAELLDHVARTTLARELVIGASVYRVPVDDSALIAQLADETDPVPDGFAHALATARAAGLVAPVVAGDAPSRHFVHRWTARAIEHLDAEAVSEGHRRAARYWCRPLAHDTAEAVERLVEARYHHHAAGELEAAVAASHAIIGQLQTWGQYGRATELARETRDWLPRDSVAAAGCTHELGVLARLRGQYDSAETCLREALEIRERLGDQAGLAASYHELGTLALGRAQYAAAEASYQASLDIKQALGDEPGLANTYHQLGNLAQSLNLDDVAEARYGAALEIHKRLGDDGGVAHCAHQLGLVAERRGEREYAETLYRGSVEIKKRRGDQRGLASSYHQLAGLAQQRGDYGDAEKLCRASLEIEERLGNQAGLAGSYHQLGRLAELKANYDTAETRYRQSLAISQQLGDLEGMANTSHHLGSVAHRRGDHTVAEARYRQSLAIDVRLGNESGQAVSYDALAELNVDQGDDADATRHQIQALMIQQRTQCGGSGQSVQRLGGLRSRLGAETFSALAYEFLDEPSIEYLHGLLDA